ncbi:MAG: membrane protein insertion efficiency factor YidD [Gammaproteobacteria bacterium]|nr:membrane protein insertion efficiency factor YidD [Gammaproteobacteria bacterium]MCI0590241.1 membrane protein insertion efficiency factor YidD [Gammaproteobacteria bacterium]
MQKFLINSVRLYCYFISPLLGAHCRFYPTCSSYAREAIEQHGVVIGLGLALWRLCSCHPFHPGGYDPVPSKVIKRGNGDD